MKLAGVHIFFENEHTINVEIPKSRVPNPEQGVNVDEQAGISIPTRSDGWTYVHGCWSTGP